MHRIITIAESMTFRQMCLLEAFVRLPRDIRFNDNDSRKLGDSFPAMDSEIDDLRTQLLITPHSTFLQVLVATPFGRRCASLLGLSHLESSEVDPIVALVVKHASNDEV